MKRLSEVNDALAERLIKLRSQVLYKCDPLGKLASTNEPAENVGDQPSQLYICFGNGILEIKVSQAAPGEWIKELYSQVEGYREPGNIPSEKLVEMILGISQKHGYFAKIESGPAFYIPQKTVENPTAILINESNRDCLRAAFAYTFDHISKLQPCFAIVENNLAVSICRTVRRSADILECGVDTVQEQRKKGFGLEVVALWAETVWAAGLIPGYSTNWENSASLALAKKLDMVHYGTDIMVNLKPLANHNNEDIRRWAESILADSEQLIQGLNNAI